MSVIEPNFFTFCGSVTSGGLCDFSVRRLGVLKAELRRNWKFEVPTGTLKEK